MILVENAGGQRRLRWPAVLGRLGWVLLLCLALPLAGFWEAFHDPKLELLSLGMGLTMAWRAFGLPLWKGLRTPLSLLPRSSDF